MLSAHTNLQSALGIGTASRCRNNSYLDSCQFIELVYLPVLERKWKSSTADTEIPRIRFHLVRAFGQKLLRNITREEMQQFLDETAKLCGRSVVDHLRFRLRSIFELAISEGATDRNPAITLFTPKQVQAGRERRVLSPDQFQAVFSVLDLRERVITRLAIWEGMLPGQILALQLRDVESDCVWVRRRVYRGNLDDPKTDVLIGKSP